MFCDKVVWEHPATKIKTLATLLLDYDVGEMQRGFGSDRQKVLFLLCYVVSDGSADTMAGTNKVSKLRKSLFKIFLIDSPKG